MRSVSKMADEDAFMRELLDGIDAEALASQPLKASQKVNSPSKKQPTMNTALNIQKSGQTKASKTIKHALQENIDPANSSERAQKRSRAEDDYLSLLEGLDGFSSPPQGSFKSSSQVSHNASQKGQKPVPVKQNFDPKPITAFDPKGSRASPHSSAQRQSVRSSDKRATVNQGLGRSSQKAGSTSSRIWPTSKPTAPKSARRNDFQGWPLSDVSEEVRDSEARASALLLTRLAITRLLSSANRVRSKQGPTCARQLLEYTPIPQGLCW